VDNSILTKMSELYNSKRTTIHET